MAVIIVVGVYVPAAIVGCSIEGADGFLFPEQEKTNTKTTSATIIILIRFINPPIFFC